MSEPHSRRKPAKQPNLALKHWIDRAQMTYREVANAVRAAAVADGHPGIAPHRTRVGHWANDGDQPEGPVPLYLAQIFTSVCRLDEPLTPADLGMAGRGASSLRALSEPSAQASPVQSQEGDLTKRRAALALIGGAALAPLAASADTAHAYTQQAGATQLAPDDIDNLEAAVNHLGATYAARPPRELWPVVATRRHQAFTLLHNKRHTLREGRALARHGGMLSVILAWLAHDLGQKELVEAFSRDAWEHGRQADAPDVSAWADDVRATDALYSGRPLDALTAATRGLALAPRDSNAAVRLTAQLTRAHAQLGNRDAFAETAARAHQFRDSLPLHGTGLFAVDATRIISYNASAHGWLGEHDLARKAATEAITHYQAMPSPHQAPTRLAIARLDLAIAHCALGDPDEAVNIARQTLTAHRPVESIHTRARHLERTLRLRYPTLPLITDFAEEVDTLTNTPARAIIGHGT
ncbi:hypothetical protein [Streptomyces sp. NPDC056672]|uniref:hypothetical protein n=1 Tax=Streptomyces sp. NPDC056672 TaxID=3345906 RepID=UPI00369E7144